MSAHENAARHDITLALLSSRPPPVSAGLHATDLALLLGVPKERQAGCPRGAYPCTPCVRQKTALLLHGSVPKVKHRKCLDGLPIQLGKCAHMVRSTQAKLRRRPHVSKPPWRVGA
eukprot:COSAG06_NODE_5107_length_3717_cov_16.795907_4_plen_116_part_00